MAQAILFTSAKIWTQANFMDPRHSRQNFHPRHPRQNFMDPPTHAKISTHATHAIFLTHAKILQTHVTRATHAKV